MLEIVRGRTWQQFYTVMENPEGPLSDLTGYVFKCQIRKKDGKKNPTTGVVDYPLVVEVTVTPIQSVLKLSLTRAQTLALVDDNYWIDVVGTKNAVDEAFLSPEIISVNGRPTLVT